MRCRHFLLLALGLFTANSLLAQNDDAFNKGTLLLHQRKFAEAIPYFDKVLQQEPDRIDALQNRGVSLANLRKYQEALRDADHALTVNPNFPLAYELKGFVYLLQNKWEEAIPFFNKEIELVPTFGSPYRQRGSCYYRLGEYDKAITNLNLCIKYDGQKHLAYYHLGQIWEAKNDLPKAVENYTKSLNIDPTTPDVLAARGLCLIRLGKVEEGKKDVEQAARSDPQRKEYLLGPLKSAKERNEIFIGYTSNATNFLRLKNYQFAIEDLGEAIRMEPMSAEARVVRGVAKMQARRPDAIYDFQSVIDIEKGKGEFSPYAVIYGNLASRLVKDDPSAKRLLTDAAGKFSGDGWPRPVVRFLRGEIKEADVLKAARDDDQRTEAHCYLGLDHALKGHRPEAIAHYRWVKDHNKQTLFEYTVAVAELERLERAPGKPTR